MLIHFSGALALRVAGASIGFLLNLLLARRLGAAGVGQYYLAFTVAVVLALLSRLGFDRIMVRYAAVYVDRDQRGMFRTFYGKVLLLVTLTGLVVTGAWNILSPTVLAQISGGLSARHVFVVSLAVLPLATLYINAETLKGFHQYASSILLSTIGINLFIIVGLYVVRTSEASDVIWLFVAASVCVSVLGFGAVARAPFRTVDSNGGIQEAPHQSGIFALLQKSFPLLIAELLEFVLNFGGVIFLAVWGVSSDVGIFRVALRTATLLTFITFAVHAVGSPVFSQLYSRGLKGELEREVARTVKYSLMIGTPLVLVFLLFSGQIMVIFGQEFRTGAGALSVLACGLYIYVIAGPKASVLIMTGHETAYRNVMLATAALYVCLNVLLVPAYGMMGAAVAYAGGIGTRGVLLSVAVSRLLGFRRTII